MFYLRTISLVYFVICLQVSVHAQSFMMSSVGMLTGTSSNSIAVNFKSNTSCMNVQSGIVAYTGPKSFGDFMIDCEVKQHFNYLGLKLYPNPAKNSATLRFIHPPTFSETFNISVWDTKGGMIFSRKESGYNIFSGVLLNLTNLSSGNYVLQVEAAEFMDAIKFIKIN
jgi:hypothetical protein